MKEILYKVTDPMGLHARPAGLLVREASTCKSDIKIHKGDKVKDAKSVIGVMSLGIKSGEEIKITISGEDEEDAAAKLQKFIKENA